MSALLASEQITDPLAFVIQECTFILSAMRKHNKSTSSPFAAILLNQFLNDTFYPDDSILNFSTATATNAIAYPKLSSKSSTNNKQTKYKDDDHFLSGFVELRSILSETDDIALVDIITLLQPFLVVIKSPSTSCFITDLAISSLSKFFKYSIINSNQSNIVQALSQIVSTLAHCRFEGADQTQDDILLVKIIQLLESLVLSSLGDLLTDDSMYEIISTCFSLAINTRRRDMLRSAAETSLLSITEIVFSKLKHLESKPEIDHNTKSAQVEFSNDLLPLDKIGTSTPTPEVDENNLQVNISNNDSEKDLENNHPISGSLNKDINEQAESNIEKTDNQTNKQSYYEENDELPDSKESIDFTNPDIDLSPYGIACMREYLNHTVDILLPENRYRFTEGTKALALEILIRIIEVTGSHLPKHNQLFSLISDNCCHHLVQLIQNSDSSILVTLSLKLVLYFSLNYPNLLKIQLELVFVTIIQSIVADEEMLSKDLQTYNDTVFEMSRKGKFETTSLTENEINELKKEFDTNKSQQSKEFLIEALSVLWCRSPYLFINLFKSYDCDFDRTDLTSSFIKLLCRLSYSDVSLLTTNNVPPICLDGLLSFVNNIYNRIKIAINENVTILNSDNIPLLQQYTKKSDFIDSVKKWNEKPDKGLVALKEKGFIQNPEDDKEVALFLFTNSGRIDKKKLGELLAKPAKSNLLKEFVGLLDFKNLRPDESLRLLLNYFRLPGEAQQIDRIVSTFNERYIECQDAVNENIDSLNEEGKDEEEEKVLPDSDAMYVLSFSIIMLNTDLHNPNVKKPMTLTDYQRNLRGCYKGKDFPIWYTEKMYNSIKEKEIIMPEEHKGTAKWFETVWHSIVAEQDNKRVTDADTINDSWTSSNGSDINELLAFDKILFGKHCKDLISVFTIMFDDATHDSVITKMMSIVEKCAAIAIYFGMDEIVDSIIEITSHLSTLTGVKKSEFSLENKEILPIIEIQNENGKEKSLYVSDLSVLFGRDYRAQLSMIVLFRILKRFNYKVTKGWYYSVKAILKLFEIGLINPNVFEEFQNKLEFEILNKPDAEFTLNKDDVLKDNGLFSTFSSYLKGLSTDSPEPTEEEIEITLSAIEFINTIGINNLFFYTSRTKDFDSMNKLVQILIALLPTKNESTERFYIEETLFLLEVSVCYLLVTKNNKLINQLFIKCDSILSSNGDESNKDMKMSTVCRILSYKLLLVQFSSNIDNNKIVLDSTIDKIYTLATTSRDSFVKHGINVLKPLEQLSLDENLWSYKEIVLNNKYWVILRIIASLPKNTEIVYNFISVIIKQHSILITYDNFMDILGLLDEISAVGAYGAQWEHEYDKLIDNGLNVTNKKNPYQELVNIGLKSITLTCDLSDVLNTENFQNSIKERNNLNSEVVIPWYPLIEAISHQCYNPCRQVRHHAINILSQLLISNKTIPIDELSLDKILDAACLRLLLELMKPEVAGTDVKGMIKTQRDILSLTCKVLLTHEFKDLENAVEKLFAISSQLLQKNRKTYPHSGHEDEVIEILRNLLMIRREQLDLAKLKGYKMDGALKKLVEDVMKEK
jgi:brefeldin A-resistance guanine nucleotide exchange factor 1